MLRCIGHKHLGIKVDIFEVIKVINFTLSGQLIAILRINFGF